MTSIRILAAAALLTGCSAAFAEDPAAAFRRMFTHQSAPTAPFAMAPYRADPVALALAAALDPSANAQVAGAAQAEDAVLASFRRMLNHEPNHARPAAPPDIGADPLIAAVVLPLLRAGLLQVASTTPGRGS